MSLVYASTKVTPGKMQPILFLLTLHGLRTEGNDGLFKFLCMTVAPLSSLRQYGHGSTVGEMSYTGFCTESTRLSRTRVTRF